MAVFAHVSCIVAGVFGPLIIFLIKKDSPFVAYHAIQAMLVQACVMVFSIVILFPLIMCTFGMAAPLAMLPMLIVVYGAIQANKGVWHGYPLIDKIGLPEGVEL
jgi:uncharacterized membrane protein